MDQWNRTESPVINPQTYVNYSMTKESRLYNGGKTVSSINGSEKTGQLHVKTRVENSLPPYTKVNSKWIKDLHV